MKKLLVICLVFSLASIASATISMDLSGTKYIAVDETLTVSVSSDTTDAWLGYIIVEDGGDGALSNPETLTGDISETPAYSEGGWGVGYEITIADSGGNISSGIQVTVDYVGLVLNDTCVISLWDDSVGYDPGDVQGSVTVIVPEPMTIALLGLGGLLLRRRK